MHNFCIKFLNKCSAEGTHPPSQTSSSTLPPPPTLKFYIRYYVQQAVQSVHNVLTRQDGSDKILLAYAKAQKREPLCDLLFKKPATNRNSGARELIDRLNDFKGKIFLKL